MEMALTKGNEGFEETKKNRNVGDRGNILLNQSISSSLSSKDKDEVPKVPNRIEKSWNFKRKKCSSFNYWMMRRLDQRSETALAGIQDDVLRFKKKSNVTPKQICTCATYLENGYLGWNLPKEDFITEDTYEYYRFWRSKLWKRIFILASFLHLSLLYFEPPHSTMYREDDDWVTEATIIPTRGDRAIELVFVGIYILDLYLQYRAMGFESFSSDFFYRNDRNVILKRVPQIYVVFIVPVLVLNTIICFLYPPFPQYSKCLRALVPFRKLLNVNKIAVSILEASKGVFEVLVMVILHVFLFSMLGYVLFSSVGDPNFGNSPNASEFCDFDGSKDNTGAIFCSTYDPADCEKYFSSPSNSLYHLTILLTTANYPDIMLPAYRCSPFASVFFIVYLLIGLYLLMNLITAVVYTHYSRHVSGLLKSHRDRREAAIERTFQVITKTKTAGSAFLGIDMGVWIVIFDALRRSKIRRCPTILGPVLFDMFCDDDGGDSGHPPIIRNTKQLGAAVAFATELNVQSDPRRLRAAHVRNLRRQSDRSRVAWIKLAFYEGIGVSSLEEIVNHKRWRHFWNCALVMYIILQYAQYALDARGMDSVALNALSSTLLFSFLIEITVGAMGIGAVELWERSLFDKLDIVLVIMGTIGEIVGYAADSDSVLVVDALPMLRIIRVLRLMRTTKNFRIIVNVVTTLSGQLVRYLAVLFLLFYFYASIGMEIFSNRLHGSGVANSSYGQLNYYKINFDTPGSAFVALWEQMIVNQWPVIMEGCMATGSVTLSVIYFISFQVLCVIVVSNVIIAFFLFAYEEISSHVATSMTGLKLKSETPSWRPILDACALKRGHLTADWMIKRHESAKGLNLYGSIAIHSEEFYRNALRGGDSKLRRDEMA